MAEAAHQQPDAEAIQDGPEPAGALGPIPESVLLRGQYRIHPAHPLPGLDSPSAQAYLAEDTRDRETKLFALICTPSLPPRLAMMDELLGNPVPGMITMVEFGPVDWQLLGQRCMAIVFEQPGGPRLSKTPFGGDVHIQEHDVIRTFVHPVAHTLMRLTARGMSHRAIRPNNLYLVDGDPREVILGECVTSPPGFDQPMIFETIERGMAAPGGRGEGALQEDLYALGVSIVFTMLRRNPVQDHSPERIRLAKIERGSFAAICGNERLPMQAIEPVRGMLGDDPEDRWGADALQIWMAGARHASSARKATSKADNGLMFGGREHFVPRSLANAFSLNPVEAAPLIRDGRLETWLRRQLKNIELADNVLAAVVIARAHQSHPMGSDDYVVAKICIILDPLAPIRYKGFFFMSDGYGAALAVEFLHHGAIQVPAEILVRDIPELWLSAQRPGRRANVAERSFAGLRITLQNTEIGYGVERCLYEANPGLPCQSPLVVKEYATTPAELLIALDEASKKVDTKVRPMDRHIAAFLAARFKTNTTDALRGLASQDDRIATLAMLTLLSTIQTTAKAEGLHGLTTWVGGHMNPAINTYRNRKTRRDLERDLPKVVSLGSLSDLLDLIDNAETRHEDQQGYALATERYAAVASEVEEIQNGDTARQETAETLGQQAAAMGSILITMIVVCITFLVMNS